jgi:hypothetical protein
MNKIILTLTLLTAFSSTSFADPKWVIDRDRAIEMNLSLTTQSTAALPAATLPKGLDPTCVHRHPAGCWHPNLVSPTLDAIGQR